MAHDQLVPSAKEIAEELPIGVHFKGWDKLSGDKWIRSLRDHGAADDAPGASAPGVADPVKVSLRPNFVSVDGRGKPIRRFLTNEERHPVRSAQWSARRTVAASTRERAA
jgi:hypothetical protein